MDRSPSLKKYKQRRNYLARKDGEECKHCCIGVACEINKVPFDWEILENNSAKKHSGGKIIQVIKGVA